VDGQVTSSPEGDLRRLKLARFAPALFVLLWSTGFVGAKYGLPYADPFVFLSIRVLIAAALLFVIAYLLKMPVRIGQVRIATLLNYRILSYMPVIWVVSSTQSLKDYQQV
jgi:drug/metabolite transporter (DMT)-like permease